MVVCTPGVPPKIGSRIINVRIQFVIKHFPVSSDLEGIHIQEILEMRKSNGKNKLSERKLAL
ncbi:hypothetical protein LEP1GSC050_1179 [Leptospira broomii serovar Hurstbridge str. 5399]|uniref:Uncharacterized protein n=1 Tax=Leptospira broomii serovar Hurstbridge str. 5399 TaxID=1049789 RepID=T0GN77_9LEPT|nr:hypothetical protein LEP1GSC050_1179 [Leptospira broomii serovar Hurstbridge str. 5399]